MNKYQSTISIFLLCAGMSSCSTDNMFAPQVEEGNVPITLSGILPLSDNCGEAGTTTYTNIYLSAKVEKGGKTVEYFKNKAFDDMTLPSYVDGNTNATKITLEESPNYPLNDVKLHLFAHSGEITDDGDLKLTAGSGNNDNNKDFIISNGTDGQGTLGSSQSPSTILTFRHIMTKVYVDVVLNNDASDTPTSAPKSIKITLTDGLAVLNGNYPITSGPAGTVTGTGNYTLQKGINYLIPNGSVLADQSNGGTNTIHPIKALTIDDYIAQTEDISNLGFTPATGNTHQKVELLPGYAYKLTFNIKRLKVTSITFTKVHWDKVILGNENSSYVPAKLNLNLGSYSQAAPEDAITKVVLHTDSKQYVGNIIYDKSAPVGQFVTLPTAGTNPKVDLYTSQGLLIAGVAATAYTDANPSSTDKNITVSLSAGGMKTKDGNACSTTNPYLVETPLQFMNLAKETSGTYFQQENDLDLESLNAAFTPVKSFNGTYDGNGKRILNATFSGNGLFTTNSGMIKNIRIASGKIAATAGYAGSICKTNTGTIVACINEAQIHGTATHAGGVCGKNSGSIIACLNTGDIFTGTSYSGGICGENTSTTAGAITACVNVGMMNRASTKMAGICGTTVSGTSLLKTCYWLTGTAKKYSGNDVDVKDTEVAAYVTDAKYTPANDDDVADLSPQKLREDHDAKETNTTSTLLSTACNSTDYKFTYDVKVNGCVWPMPVKKQP